MVFLENVRSIPRNIPKFFEMIVEHWWYNIGGSVGPIVCKNRRAHPWVDPHQVCEFHDNQFKTATCTVRSCTYINNYPASYFSGQDGLKTGVTNMKSALGPQTTVILRNAGSESIHPTSPYAPTFAGAFKLCSAETFGESPHVTSPSCISMFSQFY